MTAKSIRDSHFDADECPVKGGDDRVIEKSVRDIEDLPETIFGHCAFCEREIQPAEACVTLDLRVEREEQSGSSSGVGGPAVEVLHGELVLALCEECGHLLDGPSVRQALQEYYREGVSLRAAIGRWLLLGGDC